MRSRRRGLLRNQRGGVASPAAPRTNSRAPETEPLEEFVVSVYGIDHVQLAIPVGGEHQARRFYGAILGLTEIPKPMNLAARGGAWFRCGPLQLHLGVEADFRPARKAHPALLVADLAQIVQALAAAGFEVNYDSELIEGFERIFTADPFGNRIELLQPHGHTRCAARDTTPPA